jgi:hypothetical protein
LPFDPNNAPDDATSPLVLGQNQIDNSDFDYSKKGYTGAGAADDDQECYNFYRQRFIKVTDVVTTAASNTITSASNPFSSSYTYPMDFVLLNGGAAGVALSGYINRNGADNSAKLYSDAAFTTPLNVTPTLVNATLWFGTTLAESSTNAVKASGHSTFAANEGTNTKIPRWDRTNGWLEMGSDTADKFDITTPLPINLVRAGVTFYFRCIVSQRSGTSGSGPVRMSFGIWDSSSAQKRFLEGSNFDISGSPVGTTGATSYDYNVLADLDDGRTLVSDTVTIANGNASLSALNYNRLTWANVVGVLRFRIYRKVGGVTKRIFTITNGAHDYNDYGTDEGETPASLPTAGGVRPIAYAVSTAFDPEDIGSGSWLAVLMQVTVPATYDSSATTDKQWLRIQVEGNTHDERMILMDRVMLSTSNGGWARSARDLNKIATSVPSSTPPDGGGQGGTGTDDGREGTCFPLDTLVLACDRDGKNVRPVPIGELKRGDYVFSGDRRVFRIRYIRSGTAKELAVFTLSHGVQLFCTLTERFITSRADVKGTLISNLTLGDEMLGWSNGRVSRETIEEYVVCRANEPVRTLKLAGGHTFVVGAIVDGEFRGVIAHNEKILN